MYFLIINVVHYINYTSSNSFAFAVVNKGGKCVAPTSGGKILQVNLNLVIKLG
jgi:hypothetical protein